MLCLEISRFTSLCYLPLLNLFVSNVLCVLYFMLSSVLLKVSCTSTCPFFHHKSLHPFAIHILIEISYNQHVIEFSTCDCLISLLSCFNSSSLCYLDVFTSPLLLSCCTLDFIMTDDVDSGILHTVITFNTLLFPSIWNEFHRPNGSFFSFSFTFIPAKLLMIMLIFSPGKCSFSVLVSWSLLDAITSTSLLILLNFCLVLSILLTVYFLSGELNNIPSISFRCTDLIIISTFSSSSGPNPLGFNVNVRTKLSCFLLSTHPWFIKFLFLWLIVFCGIAFIIPTCCLKMFNCWFPSFWFLPSLCSPTISLTHLLHF